MPFIVTPMSAVFALIIPETVILSLYIVVFEYGEVICMLRPPDISFNIKFAVYVFPASTVR